MNYNKMPTGDIQKKIEIEKNRILKLQELRKSFQNEIAISTIDKNISSATWAVADLEIELVNRAVEGRP